MKISRLIVFHILSIIGLVCILAFINHIPGTTLSGWDNLQTDLNPILGIKRAFFSVWQEYQSFGLVAGMAHAADLPRAICVWLLSLVMPSSLIRYSLHFLLVLSGALGMYWLLLTSGLKEKSSSFALAGSIAYIFSFASLQLLALPFEAFVFFYAFLPWELGLFYKLLEHKHLNKKLLWTFIAISIIGAPQWVAQQLFIVFMVCLLLSGTYFAYTHHTKRRFFGLLFLIIAINSFWLLPQIYFLIDNGSVVWTNKINQLSTGDILYSNLAHGTFKDFVRQEGFFYDRLGVDHNYLFHAWKAFREMPLVVLGIYTSFICALFGFFSKSKLKIGFTMIASFVALALLINTFPLNILNGILRSSNFVNQVFRSPFTKFAIPYALVFSFFFAHGLQVLASLLAQHYRNSKLLFAALGTTLMIAISLPAFNGHYLIPDMQVSYPKDYAEVMDYFAHQDKNSRIALMPDYTFWGWFFHTWGYNGSGFIWYGIEQPIISRTFDVWSTQSESYFWEMKAALEAENIDHITQILDKYAVDYIILDTSLEAVSSNIKALQFDRILALLDDTPTFHREYKGEHLFVYKYNAGIPRKNFVSRAQQLPNIQLQNNITAHDAAFVAHGLYKTETPSDIIYPFGGLFSQTRNIHKSWDIVMDSDSLIFTAALPKNMHDYDVVIPQYEFDEKTLIENVEITFKGNVEITIDEQNINVHIPLLGLPMPDMSEASTYPCGTIDDEKLGFDVGPFDITSQASDTAVGCISLAVPYIDQRFGYVMKISSTTTLGRPPFFALTDQTKSQSIIEERLLKPEELFIIPPHFMYGLGYNFNFQTDSYPHIPATNTISRPELYFIPYDILANIRFEKKGLMKSTASRSDTSTFDVKKTSVYMYGIDVKYPSASDEIILWQSFDKGWVAFTKLGTTLPHHRINNWANGWTLESERIPSDKPLHIIIFFWPQLLEYAGFVIAALTLLSIGFFVTLKD